MEELCVWVLQIDSVELSQSPCAKLQLQTHTTPRIMLVRRVSQRLFASPLLKGIAMENGSTPCRTKVLTMDTLNPNIKVMEYAVRGPIVLRAAEIEKELEQVRL